MIPHWSTIRTIVFDFDGVFTNNKVYLNDQGHEFVQCNRSDGLGFDFLRRFQAIKKWKVDYFILSTEKNLAASARAKKLGINIVQGVNDKVQFLEAQAGLSVGSGDYWKSLIYFGNDLNDLFAIKKAGFSVSPSDAHPTVLAEANLVLPVAGGDGCVRYFIELLMNLDAMDSSTYSYVLGSSGSLP